MRTQVRYWLNRNKALVDTQYKPEVKQAFLVVIGHIEYDHTLTLSLVWKAEGGAKEQGDDETVYLQ